MRLPDAEGFIAAARALLDDGNGNLVCYLHDEGGEIAAVVCVREVIDRDAFPDAMFAHTHLEPSQGEEVPWLAGER